MRLFAIDCVGTGGSSSTTSATTDEPGVGENSDPVATSATLAGKGRAVAAGGSEGTISGAGSGGVVRRRMPAFDVDEDDWL